MRTEVVTSVQVSQGKVHVRNRARFQQEISELPDGDYEYVVKRKTASRSPQANRYYWGVVIHELSEYTGFTPDEMHEFCKQKFLPDASRNKLVFFSHGNKEVCEYLTRGSTAKLTVIPFYEYCRDIIVWASADLGVAIPDPDEAGAVT